MKWGKAQIATIIVVLGLGTAAFLYYPTKKVEKETKVAPSLLWELALDKVHEGWKGEIDLSDPHLKKNCPHLYRPTDDIPRDLKACRREVFQCFFKEREIGLKFKKEFFPLRVLFPENFLNKSKSSEDVDEITLSLNGIVQTFELNNFCQQVELPQGAYWGDRSSDKSQRIWHTSDVEYSIDRFLVRNIDIREWLLRDEKAPVEKLEKYQELSSDFFSPSVDLTPELMEGYCHFKKAEVLSSHVRASVTFHHGRAQKSQIGLEPPSYNTPPHPFGLRQQDSPQYRYSHSSEEEPEVAKADCRLIYARECLSNSYFEIFPNSLGWTGVSELFGGPAEYVKNLKYPRKNLHPSSYYHPISSKVHQAGVRVYWSGKGHRRIDFNFFTEPFFEVNKNNPEDSFDVGFRCMRKRLVVR